MIPSNPALYRADIDGLRAYAVISVLLFHLGIPYFPGGYVGVDVFFVISGFLITGIIRREVEATGHFRFGAFYLRRVRRLFPVLFVTLLLTTIAGALLLSPVHLRGGGGSLASALLSVSNIYFWTESGYFDTSANLKPLLHTWSLSIEDQFYLFWPWLLLLLLRRQRRYLPPLILAMLGLASLGLNLPFGHGAGGGWNEDAHSTIFFLLPFRIFEFVIGGLLVWLAQTPWRSKVLNEFLFWLGMGLMAYAVTHFNDKMLFPSWPALVPCLGAACVIQAGNQARSAMILTFPIMVRVGLFSYSLYLVHWPIIVFWRYLGGELGWMDQGLIMVASLVLAYVGYRFVEVPFRTRQIDLARPVWRYPLVLASGALLATGLHISRDGWTWRTPPLPAAFDYVGSPATFHKTFYGGAGYPFYGPIKTTRLPDIVLMGDSHARHYAEGLYQVLAVPDERALYMAAGASCFHLPRFTRITAEENWDRTCPAKLAQALEYIDANPSAMVILSHSWLSQISRAGMLDTEGRRLGKRVTVDDVIQGILALKARIGARPLVVIGHVPGSGRQNLYDLLTRPRLPFSPAVEPDRYLLMKPMPDILALNIELRLASKQSGQFLFLDPHDVLCHEGECRNTTRKNQLVYSDDVGHLSKYGSVEVISGFVDQLRASMASGQTNPTMASHGVRQ